ncbi:hypothetical protein HPB49_008787 [Dermacentor silvarum]|uniref:Uncharacterized protein n=1 Tax=Dermacentor silvarum TaxID=543639 RepID=A0ACB8CWE2_DERSI|nr:hypothetical protein HPB49_008787 [Dermacentor silvarum]
MSGPFQNYRSENIAKQLLEEDTSAAGNRRHRSGKNRVMGNQSSSPRAVQHSQIISRGHTGRKGAPPQPPAPTADRRNLPKAYTFRQR